jgi:hypothetical protein
VKPESADVLTQCTTASYTVCSITSSELTSSLARRPAAHPTTKRQILLLHTHNRPIQTTCWRHITLHVKLQPNALIHSHKTPSLRTTHNCTIAKLPHCLTSRKIRHGCYQLFRWVRSFRHNKQHDARKQEPL